MYLCAVVESLDGSLPPTREAIEVEARKQLQEVRDLRRRLLGEDALQSPLLIRKAG